jgi:hypothetical protein
MHAADAIAVSIIPCLYLGLYFILRRFSFALCIQRGLHDTVSSFISIDELINHPVLDPNYISIPDYVKAR